MAYQETSYDPITKLIEELNSIPRVNNSTRPVRAVIIKYSPMNPGEIIVMGQLNRDRGSAVAYAGKTIQEVVAMWEVTITGYDGEREEFTGIPYHINRTAK